jgi:uncharacterized membrane protein
MVEMKPCARQAAWRLTACAGALSLGVTWSAASVAQTPALAAPAAPDAMAASLSHSALKGVTLKAISITTSFFIFTAGTGSAAVGGLMAGLNGVGGLLIYTGNDYAWDYFSPNTNLSTNQQSFGVFSSLSRNTLKYITLKPMLTVLNVGIIYAFTETLAATAATSTAAIILLPAAFYLNNTLWDWHDWYYPPQAQETKQPAAAK